MNKILESLKKNNETLRILNEDNRIMFNAIMSLNGDSRNKIMKIFSKMCTDLERHIDTTGDVVNDVEKMLKADTK